MKYDYTVKHKGKFYAAGEEVPETKSRNAKTSAKKAVSDSGDGKNTHKN